MSTGLTIVTDALLELSVIGAGDTPEPSHASFALRKLNQLLARWTNSRLMLPTLTKIEIELDGSASYLVGPGGVTATARPIKVNSAKVTTADGRDSPVDVMTRERWDAIPVKDTQGGPPSGVWYDAQNTNGVVYVYPQSTGYTLTLTCQTLLTTMTLASTLVLPEGFETALILTLAEDCASAFGLKVDQNLRMRALGARSVVKRTNLEPIYLEIEGLSDRSAAHYSASATVIADTDLDGGSP